MNQQRKKISNHLQYCAVAGSSSSFKNNEVGLHPMKKDNCKNVMLEFGRIGRRQGSKC